MDFGTIGTSDGRMYNVVHEEMRPNADVMVAYAILLELRDRSGKEPNRGFRINYLRPFLLRQPMSQEQLLEHARGEVIIWLEGDAEGWENPETNGYLLNLS